MNDSETKAIAKYIGAVLATIIRVVAGTAIVVWTLRWMKVIH